MKFILLGTAECHLCEEAEMLINTCLYSQKGFTLKRVDIAENSRWLQDYALRIPVLLHEETANTLDWPFGQADVIHFVNSINL